MKKSNLNNLIFINKYPKNFLIFLPMIFSYNINYLNTITCLAGFIIFSLIVNICYLTNNFVDHEIDKYNKLKSNCIILKKNTIIFLNSFLFFFILVLFFTDYFSFYLYLYLALFYIYTFYLKKVFLIDIIILSFFYIIRIYYGSDIIDEKISVGFIIFFLLLFLILAIYKRITQININKLKNNNKVVAYSVKSLKFLKYTSDCLIIFSIIFLANFLLLNNSFFENIFKFNFSGSLLQGFFILILYILNFLRIRKLVFFNKVKKDIVDFILSDPYSLLSSIALVIVLGSLYL